MVEQSSKGFDKRRYECVYYFFMIFVDVCINRFAQNGIAAEKSDDINIEILFMEENEIKFIQIL